MFDKLEVFRMATDMARHAGVKQAVSAQNIANADTPGYVARAVPEFSEIAAKPDAGAQRATRAKHLNGSVPGQDVPISMSRSGGSPNGNAVSLETEMLESVAAKRQHDRALAIYKSSLNVRRSNSIRPDDILRVCSNILRLAS